MPDLLTDVDSFPRTAVLSRRVHRVLGLNPSAFTGPGTNTYIVGADRQAPLIIDTGSGRPEYLALLREYLASAGIEPIARCLLTHVHPDHIGGARDLLELFPGLPIHKLPWPGQDEKFELPLISVRDGERFQGEGYALRAIHTPGHAQDHICYYLQEEKALFTGDMILGVGTTVIPTEGGDLGDYLASLRRIQTLDLERIYPGHGPVIDKPQEKVAAYLEHRLKRERQIVQELDGGGKTSWEIVGAIYREYPTHLHRAAEQSVLSHIFKLEREGRVERSDGEPPVFALCADSAERPADRQ